MSAFDDETRETERERVLANSAVMAVGTIFSRLSGFVRSALLVAALGASLHADLFNIANTIPNMLYILLAGGVVNAVLVPQLVRTMKLDADGGDAYANRIITLVGLVLGAVTVLLVVAAPWVMSVFLDNAFSQACLAAQRDSVIDFARLCLPQVFFYGMFVLIGQVLNARGKFGPMMWAPIANNAISVAVLVIYLVAFGPAKDAFGAFTPGQELLLGLGATIGIAAQFLILIPYLRATGFAYRPRFDFVGTGLGHTMRLGLWTVLFVVVNQVAYTVVVRLASGGTADVACDHTGATTATGYTVYAQTALIIMVPHAIVTVSLATAILPRLAARAADGDREGVAQSLTATLRSALALIIPFAALLPVVARDASHLLWGYGAASDDYDLFAPSLSLFGIGLIFFTAHYLMLRGFYSLERTDVVFWIQCCVAATNIAVAMLLVVVVDAIPTAPALVVAYIASYVVGASVSVTVLSRRLGGLAGRATWAFLCRIALASVVAAAAAAGALLLTDRLVGGDSWLGALLDCLVAGVVGAVVLLVMARALRVEELRSMVRTFTRRLPLVPRR